VLYDTFRCRTTQKAQIRINPIFVVQHKLSDCVNIP
jgi:hypothetical protein